MRPLAGAILAGVLLTGHAARAAEGMPQLDFANPMTIAQVVWGGIIFFVLYLLLANWALPKVGTVLEHRAATITADLEAAREAKEAADAAVADMMEATRQAQATAQAEISAAVARAKAEADAQAATLNARLEAQVAEAEQRIAATRTAAIGALRGVATETTSALIARLTGWPAENARVDTAVGVALAARGQG
jgi:F-type H+-transporting ATPase subunit b